MLPLVHRAAPQPDSLYVLQARAIQHAFYDSHNDSDSDSDSDNDNDNDNDMILPPAPPIASRPLASHATPALALLAAHLPLHRVYRPVAQARPLHHLERGFWRIPRAGPPGQPGGEECWDEALFRRFWAFLRAFVREGRAGWGVWAVRDRLVVRLYGWGELAPVLYLLLYVASERSVRRLGLQWCDASDSVVVQM